MGLNLLTWPMPLNLSYLIGFWPIGPIIITLQNYVTRSVRICDIEIHRREIRTVRYLNRDEKLIEMEPDGLKISRSITVHAQVECDEGNKAY